MVKSIYILGVHTESTIGPTFTGFDVGAQIHFVNYSQKSLTFPPKNINWMKFSTQNADEEIYAKKSKFCKHFKNNKILYFQTKVHIYLVHFNIG